jgi:murein DD-endopeptidase MepM/ murein hydrolase activator NlpD
MEETPIWVEIGEFFSFLVVYFRKRFYQAFKIFEWRKGQLVEGLYQKRGKYVRPCVHSGMVGLVFVGVTLGPKLIAQTFPGQDEGVPQQLPGAVVLGVSDVQTETFISDKPRAEVIDYAVGEGDTLSTIADKFGVSLETILWLNDLTEKSKIKPGQRLKIPPVTGVVHKVRRGETIYSIAKKYDVEAQNIVNWPFNTFTNDETFALAVGQSLIVPGGVKPEEVAEEALAARRLARLTPDAGTVSATGQFIWPAAGQISQYPVWYHMAVDISNKGAPDILAADAGRVVVAGYPDRYGYGNRVMIDHGNGFQTLYAHLSQIYVKEGQTVARGAAIGKMGSTGRSTGVHLHFEVRKSGVLMNPLNYLK